MKILLDECLPRRLLRDLSAYSATTVPRQGWAGLKDGELLQKTGNEFDVFITLDRGLTFQQNLSDINLCIVVIQAVNSRYETLQPDIPNIIQALERTEPGLIIRVP